MEEKRDKEMTGFMSSFERARCSGYQFAPQFVAYHEEKMLISIICRPSDGGADKHEAFLEMFAIIPLLRPKATWCLFMSDSWFVGSTPEEWARNHDHENIIPSEHPNRLEAFTAYYYRHRRGGSVSALMHRPYFLDNSNKMWWLYMDKFLPVTSEWETTASSVQGFVTTSIERMFVGAEVGFGTSNSMPEVEEYESYLRMRGHDLYLPGQPRTVDVIPYKVKS